MKKLFYLLLLAALILNCKKESNPNNTVTVSILPQRYLIKRIVGNKLKVKVILPPGANPATYNPSPKQIKELNNSKIYFTLGHLPFEKLWIEKIISINKNIQIVDTSIGVNLIKTEENHIHNNKTTNNEYGIDPHIWLSPREVKLQIRNVFVALINSYPDYKYEFAKNYNLLLKDINDVDKEIKKLFSKVKNKKFIVFHPSWSYFARDYGLIQISIEIEGKSPTPGKTKELIDIAKRENLKTVFIQKQFDTNPAQAIAKEIGAKIIQLDPLEENWLNNIKNITNLFYNSFEKKDYN